MVLADKTIWFVGLVFIVAMASWDIIASNGINVPLLLIHTFCYLNMLLLIIKNLPGLPFVHVVERWLASTAE